jgi:ABC-type transporter MlaC component|tara:strand:+ start:993 stop:1169 length:177 start_codon:yes stop_codon:yes gene_type:complete
MKDEYSWKDAMQNIVNAINIGIKEETAKIKEDEKLHVEILDKKTHAVVNVTRIKKEKE